MRSADHRPGLAPLGLAPSPNPLGTLVPVWWLFGFGFEHPVQLVLLNLLDCISLDNCPCKDVTA